MSDLWYKDAVVYELDVKTYQDSNGDGIGDLPGLTRRLPHVAGLGATCLWLQPFFPSPLRDDGYDVSDFFAVDPRLGMLDDFDEFMRQASRLGLRVITDLVVNHTSDQHPWFRSARRDRGSPYRDYYVWSDREPENLREGIVFPGPQRAIWSYDAQAGAWYHHRFYAHEPDLNLANPAVREKAREVMGFWLDRGLAGFRLDAAPFLLEHHVVGGELRLIGHETIGESGVETPYVYLEEFRDFLSSRRRDAVLIAEANVDVGQFPDFFGREGDRVHMLFNFRLNQQLALALARRRADPLAEVLAAASPGQPASQWLNFLRNHDEMDLARLGDRQRDEVFAAFAPEERMRAYSRGIRRRLAPMLDGDRDRLELAYALLFSLPGTPMIRYGEEIGMGDDLSLPERLPVRTPMQWSGEANAGFSAAPPGRLIRPVLSGGEYGYERVNVEAQRADPDSLLTRLARLIRTRQGCPEFGRGTAKVLETDSPAVLALRSEWQGGAVVTVHNLGGSPAAVRLARHETSHWVELLAHARAGRAGRPGVIELAGYGYQWFRAAGGHAGEGASHARS